MARKPAAGTHRKKKRTLPAHIKEAADRAEARAKGKKAEKPRKPIDPPIKRVADRWEKGTEKAGASLSAAPEGKSAAGHPTDYKPIFCEIARAMCEAGATVYDLAVRFKVTRQTVYNWQATHPDFFDACALGKDKPDDRVKRSLYERSVGYSYNATKVMQFQGRPVIVEYVEHVPPDPGAAMKWLSNRRPKEWRETSRHEISGPDGKPIELTDAKAKMELARWIAFKLAAVDPEPTLIEDTPDG